MSRKKNISVEYSTWRSLRSRCKNVNSYYWKYYGGSGINVCQGWDRYQTFLNDMGKRPFDKQSIDRIDNKHGYWCGHCLECIENCWEFNCRWSGPVEQNNNRRNCFGYSLHRLEKVTKKEQKRAEKEARRMEAGPIEDEFLQKYRNFFK